MSVLFSTAPEYSTLEVSHNIPSRICSGKLNASKAWAGMTGTPFNEFSLVDSRNFSLNTIVIRRLFSPLYNFHLT